MKRFKLKIFLLSLVYLTLSIREVVAWGFFAHKLINRHAVFSLPHPLFNFYKYHIYYLTERATNPDKRRGIVIGEDVKHFIDLEYYREVCDKEIPKKWNEAVEKVGLEFLNQHGIAPWNVLRLKYSLVNAFKEGDTHQILRISADVAHYIADCNVPLHTTKNYNGQLTDQHGIHGLWESRLPELFCDEYDLFVGTAEYISDFSVLIWEAINNANSLLERVLSLEKKVSQNFKYDKYSHEVRGASLQKVYSYDFSKEYHTELDGMVEQQLKRSIKMVADFFYTCWVDAGSPNLCLDGERLKNIVEADKIDEKQKKLEGNRECD